MPLGLGTTSQEAGCDVVRARAVAAHHQPGWCQMLPRHWCPRTRSQHPRGGCSGMWAHGHACLRRGGGVERNGVSLSCLVPFS